MLRLFSHLNKKSEGQALVEFALVLLPLMLIILGIAEFGWLFNGHITLTSSAREGARVAAVGGTDLQVETAVLNHVGGSAVSVNSGDVKVLPGSDDVTVQVDGSIEPLVGFFVGNTVNLNVQAIMRLEFKDD
ncbi:TadE/TadG family type IV pilus assembly protein [Dethiobacter alkaliphilus]|uniref:TadE family protein n=1 Tax=Dethiobacter alkaliphilus AHT 1 TaxID=555088 RepID=C0GEA5_DETAL|nr:TadE/TadG family type IV pilus assembly protein [Dethiobacter alkaliphilus]EEG78399.1 TadE family protein [Dethiobacter alkaliphilus AHT 1]